MAVDILTYAVGGVGQTAGPIGPELRATMLSARLQQNAGPQFAAQLASVSPPAEPANVVSELSVAKKFEAVFVAQMMTSILPKDSEYFGDGFAGDAWRSMMSEQLANVAVKQTDFGIAPLIEQGLVTRSQSNPHTQGVGPGAGGSLGVPIGESTR